MSTVGERERETKRVVALFGEQLGYRCLGDNSETLVISHLLRLAEHVDADVLELDAEVLADKLAAGQYRDVFQHRLAALTEARGH